MVLQVSVALFYTCTMVKHQYTSIYMMAGISPLDGQTLPEKSFIDLEILTKRAANKWTRKYEGLYILFITF